MRRVLLVVRILLELPRELDRKHRAVPGEGQSGNITGGSGDRYGRVGGGGVHQFTERDVDL